jgi:UDP-N-acetyl-D-galactosamine dehydrogenase
VPHQEFLNIGTEGLLKKVVRNGCVIDIKAVLDAEALRKEGLRVWRL